MNNLLPACTGMCGSDSFVLGLMVLLFLFGVIMGFFIWVRWIEEFVFFWRFYQERRVLGECSVTVVRGINSIEGYQL